MRAMTRGGTPHKEPITFGHTVEALLEHAMKGRLDARARQRFKAIGIDLDRPLLVAYPLSVWLDAVALCAEILFPGVPRDEAWYRVGWQFGQGYGQTALGKATFALARLVGWKRTKERLARGMQTGSNYMRSYGRDLPDGSFELRFEVLPDFREALGSDPGVDPSFLCGCIDAVLQLAAAPLSKAARVPGRPGELDIVVRFLPQVRSAAS
jgi:uncharacterized protein (TIGR02265 family)